MPSILPVEKYRNTARAQFLANLSLPRIKEQAMTPLGEIPHSQYHDFSLDGSLGIRTFGTFLLGAH